MTMRRLLILLLAAGCTSPLAVEGAPCPCPTEAYLCDSATHRCVARQASTDAEPPASQADPEATICVHPGPASVRPLNPSEYASTITDLLGVTVDTSVLPDQGDLPEPAGSSPFASELAQKYLALADQAAAQAVIDRDTVLPCDPDPPGQNQCARQLIAAFGLRAWRRPLTGMEIGDLLAVFDEARRTYGMDQGYRRLLQHILASESFYLRKEVGEPTGPLPGLVSLTPYEIATRLSYFLTGSTPDDLLLALAAGGRLRTKADVEAQARRLLGLSRASAVVADFHRRWLRLDDVRDTPKDGDTPAFSTELRQALVTSAQATAVGMWGADLAGGQSALFRGPMYGNRPMAEFYALTAPAGEGFEMLQPLAGQQRFGILTFPAILSALADGAHSHAVRRGAFVLHRLMCLELPPPPSAIPPVPEARPGLTARQRFAQHSMNGTCWACHANFDPIGFALENYDGYGRWRTSDNGGTIDASSGEVGQLLGHPFQGPGGLADLLAGSEDFSGCIAQQWFRYAVGRAIESDDRCTLDELKKAYVQGGHKLRPLLLAIVRSDAFLTRTAP
jgi:hypothetical protein